MDHLYDKFKPIAILLLVSLVIWVSWCRLGVWTIRLWDESRMAHNALEMYGSKQYWVTTFKHKPDMWNTKPPLMIWLQVLSFRIFGVSEWALRAPAAMAAMGVYATVFHFVHRRLRHFWIAVWSVLILATAQGFVIAHVSRTGDFDVLMILWVCLACSSFFGYLENRRIRLLYATFIFIGLAVCTKSVAGLMFAPAWLAYAISRKRLPELLKSPHTYLAFLLLLLLVLPYYYIREQYNPGYLQAVWDNELGGRFLTVTEEHDQPWYWYLNFIVTQLFVEWCPFLFIAWFFLRKETDTLLKRGITYSALLAIVYLLVISIARTKLRWYIAPAFPFMAIVAAYGLWHLWLWAGRQPAKSFPHRGLRICLSVLVLLAIGRNVYLSVYDPDRPRWLNEMNYYIRDVYMSSGDTRPLTVVYTDYQAHIDWYITRGQMQGLPLRHKEPKQLQPGARILIHKGVDMDAVQRQYTYKVEETYPYVALWVITGKKIDAHTARKRQPL